MITKPLTTKSLQLLIKINLHMSFKFMSNSVVEYFAFVDHLIPVSGVQSTTYRTIYLCQCGNRLRH